MVHGNWVENWLFKVILKKVFLQANACIFFSISWKPNVKFNYACINFVMGLIEFLYINSTFERRNSPSMRSVYSPIDLESHAETLWNPQESSKEECKMSWNLKNL